MTELSEAYAAYIQEFSWDFYSTVTFRRLRRDQLAAASAVWRVLWDHFQATRAFVAAERHALDGIHLHLLSQHFQYVGHRAIRAYSMWLYLFKAFGNTRVEAVKSPEAVSTYCSKYVSKGEQYNLFGDPQAWVPIVENQALATQVVTAALPECAVSTSPTLWQPALPGLD